MHNRYFEEFTKLVQLVEDALKGLAAKSDEIKRLMGVYTKYVTDAHLV